MSYGLQVFSAAGVLMLDTNNVGAVFVEALTLAYGASSSKTYTDWTGRTLRIWQTGSRNHTITTSVDGGGNPVLSWAAINRVAPRQAATKILVFLS